MPRPRRMYAPLVRLSLVELPRIHGALPVLVVLVAHDDGNRSAERLAAAHAANDLDFVTLDLHPPAAAVAVLATLQIIVYARTVERDACRHTRDDRRQLRSMRLAGAREGES